jgi:hypothetical protein
MNHSTIISFVMTTRSTLEHWPDLIPGHEKVRAEDKETIMTGKTNGYSNCRHLTANSGNTAREWCKTRLAKGNTHRGDSWPPGFTGGSLL